MHFETFNAVIINLAIIVSVTLGLYFYSLKSSLKKDDMDSDFLIVAQNMSMTRSAEIFAGIFIGLMAFVISKHGIPISDFRPVDVRYLPVYFSVYYGSPLIGLFTSLTLIITKCIDYYINSGTMTEFMNNLLITTLILIISIIISRKKLNPRIAILYCLFLTLIVRSIFFIFVFYPNLNQSTLLQILTNFSIFSVLFLFTGWLINRAISISEGIHIYRTSSVFDSLTGLYNKEAFYFFLDLAYNEAIYEGRHFSLAIIDFDDFKEINDTFGHQVGDTVLEKVSIILKNSLDPDSRIRICRIGGDELAIVFKHEIYNSTEFFAHFFTELEKLELNSQIKEKVSLSVGLIDFTPEENADLQYDTPNVQDLFALADNALYKAKKNGKNQIVQEEQLIQIIEKHR